MNIFFLIVRAMFTLFCLFSFITGCGNKEEETPKTSNVVSKKIEVKKDKNSEKKATSELRTETSLRRDALEEKDLPKDLTAKDGNGGKADIYDSLIPYMEKDGIAPLVKTYNPEGKIDPFAPLFQEQPVAKQTISTSKRKRPIPQTPLEKIDLNQLKLTAIIISSSGNKAMVEEASGKGYVIEKGTPIGTKWGKVVEIKKDTVLVDEEEENLLGEITFKRKEMKLQKPFGDN